MLFLPEAIIEYHIHEIFPFVTCFDLETEFYDQADMIKIVMT
jgi:hypothetical protein